jgi:predicted membrane chloride channel (bestrophin family)
MAFPVIAARIGWTILGIAIGAVAKSEFGKEAKDMFKDGFTGMCDDHRKDIVDRKQMVKDIKEGRQK